MKYKFKKEITNPPHGCSIKPLIEFGVERDSLDKNIEALININWHGWTPAEIQMIIDKSNALSGTEEYDYQVPGSDFVMSIDKTEVHFFDWHTEQEEADFIWTFAEFITFMTEFKKFVEENS